MVSCLYEVERVMGIEPTWPAWKAGALPLSYTRTMCPLLTAALALHSTSGYSRAHEFAAPHRGRVVDPAHHLDGVADVLVVQGKVAAVGADLAADAPAHTERIDATGLVVCPGLIDLHVHLRGPGQSAKKTIATGTAAAARGGFTSMVCMPNTSPAIDNPGTVALIHERAARKQNQSLRRGSHHQKYRGRGMGPFGSLRSAGVIAIADDGHCVQNNDLMRRAMEYAKMFDLPVMDHCRIIQS